MTSLGVDVVALYVPPARLSSAASTDAAGRSLRDFFFFFLPGERRESTYLRDVKKLSGVIVALLRPFIFFVCLSS